MSRRVLGWDRIAALVVGLVLVALGVAVGAWALDQLSRFWAASPDPLSTDGAMTVYGQPWWRAASAAAGVVLALLGLWWLLSHLPRTSVGALRLPGSGRPAGGDGPRGGLTLDGSSAASVAAEELAAVRGVRSASGRLARVRGELIADLHVTAGPSTDLGELAAEVERVSGQLRQVLSRDDVRSRVRLRIAKRDKDLARVA